MLWRVKLSSTAPQGFVESLAFFGLYVIYLAVVLLPSRLPSSGPQEDVELEDWGENKTSETVKPRNNIKQHGQK